MENISIINCCTLNQLLLSPQEQELNPGRHVEDTQDRIVVKKLCTQK
jgi:hypothetical protein